MTGKDEVVWAVDWGEISATEAETVPPESPLPTSANPPPPPPPSAPAGGAPVTPLADRSSTPEPAPSPLREVIVTELVQGQRLKLTDLGISDGVCQLSVQIATPPGVAVDLSCAGLDMADHLSDERYFIFYNQPASPERAITLQDSSTAKLAALHFQLGKLPESISRLVVIAAVSEGATGPLSASSAQIGIAGPALAEFRFAGQDLNPEKTLLILELYRKAGIWKIAALGETFAGSLSALLGHYGAKVE